MAIDKQRCLTPALASVGPRLVPGKRVGAFLSRVQFPPAPRLFVKAIQPERKVMGVR